MEIWLIRIIGKQRKDLDLDLVVQAVVALGRQLAEEAGQAEAERGDEEVQNAKHSKTTEPTRDKSTGRAA